MNGIVDDVDFGGGSPRSSHQPACEGPEPSTEGPSAVGAALRRWSCTRTRWGSIGCPAPSAAVCAVANLWRSVLIHSMIWASVGPEVRDRLLAEHGIAECSSVTGRDGRRGDRRRPRHRSDQLPHIGMAADEPRSARRTRALQVELRIDVEPCEPTRAARHALEGARICAPGRSMTPPMVPDCCPSLPSIMSR